MADATTWRRRIVGWRASGLTAAEYARGRGYAPATLRWWASRLRGTDDGVESTGLRMARLVVAEPHGVAGGSGVSLDVAGVRVDVGRGFDRTTLAAVLEVLGTSSGAPR